MSKRLDELEPAFRKAAITWHEAVTAEGIDARFLQTYRTLEDQARKYRCTRNITQIDSKADSLAAHGRPDLAAILYNVGPQARPEWLPRGHLTMAGPGESKHHHLKLPQSDTAWSYAFDFGCFDSKGKYISDGNHPDYRLCGAIAEGLGLEWLGNSKRFPEAAHIQAAGLPGTAARLRMVIAPVNHKE